MRATPSIQSHNLKHKHVTTPFPHLPTKSVLRTWFCPVEQHRWRFKLPPVVSGRDGPAHAACWRRAHLQVHQVLSPCCPRDPPKPPQRKPTRRKASQSFGGLQHMQCYRAPRGCSCFPNVERSTEAGWQAEPILFKPASSVIVHLKTFNRHFSSLTSALLQETKAALLIPCLQFSQAGWGLNNCTRFKDCRSPADGCCRSRGGGDTAEIALGTYTWCVAPSCLRAARRAAERGKGPAPGTRGRDVPAARSGGRCSLTQSRSCRRGEENQGWPRHGDLTGFAGWKINVFS